MAWYRTGTVAVTNASAALVGTGTLWLSQSAPGDLFTIDGTKFYEVLTVTDDTNITLASTYTGTTSASSTYAIIRNFTSTTNATLALNLANMINKWHITLDELLQWLTVTGTVSLTNPSTGVTSQVKTPSQIQAEWVGSISKAFVATSITLTSTEAGNAFITATGALTANVNMILPTAQGHLIAVTNSTTGAFTLTVKTAAGAGVVVPQGSRDVLYCNGTDMASAFTFIQSGTGAVPRTQAQKSRDIVDTADFNTIGNGTADDTVAINNCIAAHPGKIIYMQKGIFNYTGGATLTNGTVLVGTGRNSTIIRTTVAATTLFTVSGYGAGIRSMAFYSGVTQTGGSYVVLSGSESFIDDFYMTGDFNGILMTGSAARIRHGRFGNAVNNAIRIRAEGGDTSQVIDDVLMGAQYPVQAHAGIRVRNSSALIISNTSAINQNYGLLIDPYTGTSVAGTDQGSVFSLDVDNCFFDNCATSGIRIQPSGTGSVVRLRFNQSWSSSSVVDGIYINNTGTGTVSGLYFTGHHSVLNLGSGMTVAGTVSDIQINGGGFQQNVNGVYCGSGLTKIGIHGANLGAGNGLTGNTNYGLVLVNGVNDINVTGNTILGNTAGSISDAAVTATSKYIRSNLGYNPIANTAITVTASPFTYQNTTGDTILVFVNGGTVSSITVAGKQIASATNAMAMVPQGQSVVVTYSAAPTMTYNGV